ncbi:MAG: sigma-70 family RNA polymerase sigma factor [Acidimicrobiia bacterium]|nr:sigma-70 family RNA polymerase sigma factor [Acidimicrobiia bacterium]
MNEPAVQPESPIERAKEGDHEAFRQLVEEHQHDVYSLALRLTRDPHLAHDIAQEAFIRAWRSLPKFRGDSAFGTWMHRITVNTAWTQRSRAKRHQHDEIDGVTPLADPHPLIDPEFVGTNSELRGRLESALARLPIEQRMIVLMKDVYGWSHTEISESLDISVSASKVRLHRAHLRLRDMLEHTDG